MTNGENTTDPDKAQLKKAGGDFFAVLRRFVSDWLTLKDDLDREGTITNIQNNKRMRGANAWLLMCSIMVASLGLNLNSPAVIIGAMLISPLMSPILGIGLSIGINDRSGLWVAVRHFGMSVAIALVTSFVYFLLTPLDEYTNEIAARTEPGFLDVLVAVFGGLAGIISGSRIDKSNAIPGVAIATALMPPLCVTGYGLANGAWEIAFNSFYLFFMNSTFIAMTTYLLVTFMNFPKIKYETSKERIRTQRILAAVALLMLIPSFFIFKQVLEKTQEEQKITDFVGRVFPESILDISSDRRGGDTLDVKIFLFENLSEEKLEDYYTRLTGLGCTANYSIIDAQGSGISKQEFEKRTTTMQDDYVRQFEVEKAALTAEKNQEIQALRQRIDSLHQDTVIFKAARAELKTLFPELEKLRYAKMQTEDSEVPMPTFLLRWSNRKSVAARRRDEARIYEFLKMRERLDTLEIVNF